MGDWAGQSLRADRSCWWLEGGNEPPGELNCLEEAGADRLEMVVALGGGHPPGGSEAGLGRDGLGKEQDAGLAAEQLVRRWGHLSTWVGRFVGFFEGGRR